MVEPAFNTGVIRAFECYREAWGMLKPRFGIILVITLVGMLIGSAFSIVMGPLMCGIYLSLFDAHEGREPTFERLFQGFRYFLPAFVFWLILIIPVAIMFVLVYVPMIGVALAGRAIDETQLMAFLIGTFVVEMVFALAMTCFHTLLFFGFPLIVDKNLSAFSAAKLSARAVWANLGGVASLFGLGLLLTIAGILLFCIGIYITMPLMLAATTVAYRKVFPGTLGPDARQELATGFRTT